MQVQEAYYFLKLLADLKQIQGRTKIQKLFFLLQSAGYPSRMPYFLHYYGPYSEALTSHLAWASQQGLIKEQCSQVYDAIRCDYEMTDAGAQLVDSLEAALPRSEAEVVERYLPLGRSLKAESATVLELAATVVYFIRERDQTMEDACAKTVACKPNKAETGMEAARALAEKALAFC